MHDNDAPLLIDVSRLVWRRWSATRATGIDRICQAWLNHYADRSQAVIIHRLTKAILPQTTSKALFRLLLEPEQSVGDTARFKRELVKLGIIHGRHLRDRLDGRGRIWLNPGHTGLNVSGLEAWCRRRKVRPVYLVHDLIPITHPQFCRDGEEQRHRQRMRTALATAAGVVANSRHTLSTYQTFAKDEGLPVSPAIVAWPGTSPLPPAESAADGETFFVVLGTIEGRKNHKLLLRVWQDLLERAGRQAGPASVPKLLMVGRRGWQADDVFELLDTVDFNERVVEAGALDDRALASVLGGACALLFPTFEEGFGIPLVEALAAGVPVLASDLSVFREIGQGVPELLAPDDMSAWRDAVLDFTDPANPRREMQLQRMNHFRAPTWSDHFRQVDGLIQELGI